MASEVSTAARGQDDMGETWRRWRSRRHLGHRWRTHEVPEATGCTGDPYQECLDCREDRDRPADTVVGGT